MIEFVFVIDFSIVMKPDLRTNVEAVGVHCIFVVLYLNICIFIYLRLGGGSWWRNESLSHLLSLSVLIFHLPSLSELHEHFLFS